MRIVLRSGKQCLARVWSEKCHAFLPFVVEAKSGKSVSDRDAFLAFPIMRMNSSSAIDGPIEFLHITFEG